MKDIGKVHQVDKSLSVMELVKKDQQTYADYLLAGFCMPTLLKLKPSSIVHVNHILEGASEAVFSILLRKVKLFDCQAVLLYENCDMEILLIYNKELLTEKIYDYNNQCYLQELGYECSDNMNAVIARLTDKYMSFMISNNSWDYPHEIGILLGYPLGDVQDFIRYQGKDYLLSGYWKVYHDVELARHKFEVYRSVREKALSFILNGRPLEDVQYIQESE